MRISAFVGHSFTKDDENVVNDLLACLNSVEKAIGDFDWDHALEAEAKELQDKVLEKIEGKNLLIAICTGKEFATPKKKMSLFPRLNKAFTSVNDLELKTSDWIIQEIGLAIGKKMKVIVLLERGVRKPGGLQGDLEYVEFDRASPRNCLPQLIEMITSLRPKIEKSIESEPKSDEGSTSSREADDVAENNSLWKKHIDDWTEDDAFSFLFFGVRGKDNKQIEEAFRRFNASKLCLDEAKRAEYKAMAIQMDLYIHKKDRINELKALNQEFPKSEEILSILASSYTWVGQHEDASRVYLELSKITGEQSKNYPNHLLNAAETLAKIGKIDLAREQLNVLRSIPTIPQNVQERALGALSMIENKSDDPLLYCAIAERLLELNSEESDIRFHLALKYGKRDLHGHSVAHDKISIRKSRNHANLNNLGVAYSNLKLEGLAVESYLESADQGGTTAVGNLAQSLASAGFYKMADDMCRKALQVPEFDENVPQAMASITKRKNKESEDEEFALKKIIPGTEFFRAAGAATLKRDFEDGSYALDLGKVVGEVTLSKGVISGSFEIEVEVDSFFSMMGSGAKTKKRKVVSIDGRYWGRCISLTRTETDKDKKPTLLSMGATPDYYLLNVSDDGNVSAFNPKSSVISTASLTKK